MRLEQIREPGDKRYRINPDKPWKIHSIYHSPSKRLQRLHRKAIRQEAKRLMEDAPPERRYRGWWL